MLYLTLQTVTRNELLKFSLEFPAYLSESSYVRSVKYYAMYRKSITKKIEYFVSEALEQVSLKIHRLRRLRRDGSPERLSRS